MTTNTQSGKPLNVPSEHPCCCGPMWRAPEDARAILGRRYASGEITREQYEEVQRALDAS